MKLYQFSAVLAALVVLCGCATQNDDIVQLKKDVFLLNQYSQAMITQLESIKKEDVPRINETLRTILVRIQELSIAVSRLQAQSESSAVNPSENTRGINEIIDFLIVKLKTQPDVEKVIPEFKQAGELAIPRLVDILKSEDPAMRSKTLKVLERLDPKKVGPAVLPLLEGNLPVKTRVIQLLGSSGCGEAVPKLVPLLGTAEGDLKFYTADTLVKLKYREAVPVLIGYLRDDSDQRRAFAFETLKSVTGMEFDYKYYLLKDAREGSVKKWEEWWKAEGEKFKFPGE